MQIVRASLVALLAIAAAAACAESPDPVAPDAGPRLSTGTSGTGNVVAVPPAEGDTLMVLSADTTGTTDLSEARGGTGLIGTGN